MTARRRVYTCARCGHAITQDARRSRAYGACPVCLGTRWIRSDLIPATCEAPCVPPCERVAVSGGFCAWHRNRQRQGLSIYDRAPALVRRGHRT